MGGKKLADLAPIQEMEATLRCMLGIDICHINIQAV
jgi:hypothetical protein